MGRSRATSWLIAVFAVALCAMGSLRDLHASTHAPDRVVAAACEHDGASPVDTAPASLPLDRERHAEQCSTCDLLAVLAKGVTLAGAPVVVDHAVLVRTVDAPSAADPIVGDHIRMNRTRGPPAALSRAV